MEERREMIQNWLKYHRMCSMVFITMLLWLIGTQASAHDFSSINSDGVTIYYIYNHGKTGSSVSVTFRGSKYDSYGNEYSGSVVIPITVRNYIVTCIEKDAFRDCSSLTSVTIPESVKIIESSAFSGCGKLTSVTIPGSVKSIRPASFDGCSGLTKVIVKNLGVWCNLNFLEYSSNPLYYAGHLYSDQTTEITDLVIPEGVTSIGRYAFYGCSSLTSVTIPESVTSINNYAFLGCSGLSSIVVNGNNPKFDSRENCNAIIETGSNTLLLVCKNTTIPESVTSIGSYAFSGCSGLTSVTIPNSVTSIGNCAFYGINPKSLTIGTGVQSIASNAFSAKPTKVIWLTNTPPEGYENADGTINYVANDSYTGLSNVKKYPLLSSMYEVDGIKYVPVSPAERTCDAIDCNYNADSVVLGKTVNYKGVTLAVKNVMPYICYYNNSVKSVNLSFEGAWNDTYFDGCPNITSVIWNLKDCVDFSSTNSPFAFSKDKITSFIIGDDVATIPAYICNGMRNLNSIAIPNKVMSIGQSAFNGCSGLNEVHIKDLSKWCDIYFGDANANPLSYAHRLYLNGEEIHSLTIPSDVTSIKNYAFIGCGGFTSITIPDHVTSIGSSVFHGCSSLKEATIGNGVKSIGNSMFQGCSSLEEATIGNGITSIDNSLFSGCSGLKTLILKGGKDEELQIDNKAFSSCPLDSVYIGRNITYSTTSSAGYSPFYRNTTLRTVHITSKETEISENEFYGCTNLKNITVGDGVKTIGSYAFSGCSSLEYFACGTQVDSIGKEAFSDCTAMTTFRSKAATPPRCGQQALDDINKWECTLQVPRPSIEAYQRADQWKEFLFVEMKSAEKGDTNGDEAITMADANAVVNYFLAKGTSQFIDDNFDEDAADVNGDGEVTMADANQIVNMFLNEK